VPIITAFLFHAGGHADPARLPKNANKSFIGCFTFGMGFTFDDSDKKDVASPLSEMQRLLTKNIRNKERIFPFIGGEEVNDSPTQTHHRYVINFGEMSEDEAKQWPDLMAILEKKVRPDRLTKAKDVATWPWWQFWRSRADLYEVIRNLPRVLVIARVGGAAAVAFLPRGMVYSEQLVVFALPTYSAFCALQCRVHEVWARFFGSSMKDDLRYTPSDCFETFPFPHDFETDPALESAGKEYYEFRAALMVRNHEGLTKTFNRFHDPNERSADIERLRELHAAMDRAVLNAYGWPELERRCEFLLDYEEDDEDGAAPSKKKKPYRYRWPDEVRDEVLARLLELNRQRAGVPEPPDVAPKPKKGRKKKAEGPNLPGMGE
jgi:hypothetical protein